jgi:hypothetical protein
MGRRDGPDIFHTATDAWDKHFLSTATRVRTCTVSAGEVGTTEFDLTDAQRTGLLGSGHAAARGERELESGRDARFLSGAVRPASRGGCCWPLWDWLILRCRAL